MKTFYGKHSMFRNQLMLLFLRNYFLNDVILQFSITFFNEVYGMSIQLLNSYWSEVVSTMWKSLNYIIMPYLWTSHNFFLVIGFLWLWKIFKKTTFSVDQISIMVSIIMSFLLFRLSYILIRQSFYLP